jgi:hypothetical protein
MSYLALCLGLAVSAAVSWAAKGGVPGKPPGGEDAVNNLSFPLVMTGDPVSTIPAAVPMGGFSLAGSYFIYDGVNPPCDPTDSICTVTPTYRVYLQKDPLNKWQAYSVSHAAAAAPVPLSNLDVGDNLESVPWRTNSVVRVEMVPFAATAPFKALNPMTGFEMVFVSGQGIDEVWGGKASPSAVAVVSDPGFATVQSTCMGLSLTKLAAGPGSIATPPLAGGFVWDPSNFVWLNTSQTDKIIPFGGEINVKGRMIFGHNWMMQRQLMSPGVSKDGWWRITFFSTCSPSPMLFSANTALLDPTAPPKEEEDTTTIISASEGQYPSYPRVPVIDVTNQLAFIDIYIQASSGSGGGNSGGKGGK